MKRLILISAIAASAPAIADPGVIHGMVVTRDGKEMTGVLRWDDEEIYWINHFNGTHAQPFDISGLNEEDQQAILDRQPGPTIRIGDTVIELVKWLSDDDMSRTEAAIEFGAIEKLEIDRGDNVIVHLRDGTRRRLHGGSNDIGADIQVKDMDGNQRELDWDDIEEIRFSPAPDGHPGFPSYTYGRVTTTSGVMEGLVEWDAGGGAPAERIATDEIDGNIESGEELSFELGDIRSIVKRPGGSLVVTKDSEEVYLNGSNDVDGRNSGIVVSHPEYGRAVIGWNDFERVDYAALPEGFVPTREAWAEIGPLTGTVTTTDGKSLTGALAYDVDESHGADTLQGKAGATTWHIPMRLIRSVEREENAARVTLHSGRVLSLSGERDATSSNNGVIVDKRYVPWENVESVRFD